MAIIRIPCRPCGSRGGFEVQPKSPTESIGWRKCPTCKGSCVEVVDNTCPKCHGSKRAMFAGVDIACGQCLGKGTIEIK